MNSIRVCLIYTFILISFSSYSQTNNSSLESIKILFDKLYYAENDTGKNRINEQVQSELEMYLKTGTSDYDQLKDIKNLYSVISNDENVLILTWYIQFSDNTVNYFGYVKYYLKDMRKYYVEKLFQNTTIKLSDNLEYDSQNWYGAVYYEIITKKHKGKNQYILLGWDANNLLTNRKIIDSIHFEEGSYPTFGENIFQTDQGYKKRILFEYAERVHMNLQYNSKLKMIIWDHLSPSKTELTGHYEYYGPDMTFDGYIFEKGKWRLIKDIELGV